MPLSPPSDVGSSSVSSGLDTVCPVCHRRSVVHTEDRAAGPEGADVEYVTD